MKNYTCECGGKMSLAEVEVSPGIKSGAYKCEKCGEKEFDEEQMREALRKKKSLSRLLSREK